MHGNLIGFRVALSRFARQQLRYSCRRALLIAMPLLAFSSAHADCIDGTRKRTAEELNFARLVTEHLLAAMPAPPANMWLDTAPQVSIGEAACRDTPVGALGANVRAVYEYRLPEDRARSVKARRDALSDQMRLLDGLPPDLKAEFDDFNARYFEAVREAKQAERSGNAALANRKYDEASELDRKAKAVQQRHRAAVKTQYDALAREQAALPSDRLRLSLLMTVNELFNSDTGIPQITYRVDDKELKGKSAAFRVRFVQAVVRDVDGGGGVNVGGVTVHRNRETLDMLITAIDRSRLEVLMQHPLPAEAAPVAWRVGKPAEGVAAAGGMQSSSGQAPAQAASSSASTSPAQQAASPATGKPDQPPAKQTAKTDDAAEKAKEVVNRLKGLLKF